MKKASRAISRSNSTHRQPSIRSKTPVPGNCIRLRGARQHNLKNLDIDFPLHQLTVICGVSGSGKSSLAFDTLFAEGQRRYIESFSAYTRQFLQRIDKPRFESLEPLPPSIAVTRDARSRNNRSTVGTASEMMEYLRVFFANHAKLYCYECNRRVIAHTKETIQATLANYENGTRCLIGFVVRWSDMGELASTLATLQSSGFLRLISNHSMIHLSNSTKDELAAALKGQESFVVIVDRLIWTGTIDSRWSQSVSVAADQAMIYEPNEVVLWREVERSETSVDGRHFEIDRFLFQLRCPYCDIDYPMADPSLFNFNHPSGACPLCEGFGETVSLDQNKIVPDRSLSLREGAIAPWRTPSYSHELDELIALAKDQGLPLDVPVSKLTSNQWKIVEEGVPKKKFGGLRGFFAWLERHKYKMHVRVFLSRWRSYAKCQKCSGKRLHQKALSYRLQEYPFAELCSLPIDKLIEIVIPYAEQGEGLQGTERSSNPVQSMAAENRAMYNASEPARQVCSRLRYLQNVGLGYLSLDRPMHTLSSGESQRVNLTTLLGSSLVDMLYVFDEPTVGLHSADVQRVANAILAIRDRGNTVILVEHEPTMMEIADRIIEIGPSAGSRGGEVTFDGTPKEIRVSDCLTGKYLAGQTGRTYRRRRSDLWLELHGACGRNLKNIDLRLPVGCMTAVRGPSGAGKSSLILDTLVPALKAFEMGESSDGLAFHRLKGVAAISGCRAIDQSPIPRSTRSTPATYCKAMDAIRDVFAATLDARSLQMTASHFSFNSEAGRCPACEGLGYTVVEMQFMADISLTCPDCQGQRYRPEVLAIRVRNLSIYEILQLSIDEAIDFFRGESDVQIRLGLLREIGLGYLPLGQSLATLSAGESTRLKLASVLAESKTNKRGELIVLDEPTTGLHFLDVDRLIDCLGVLLDRGNTIVVIEHNEQLLEAADYLVELGPGAGPYGGSLVSQCWSVSESIQ